MATIKQKLAAEKTMENNGVVSKSMKQVGYSPNTAKNPKVLTESKGWKELMEKYIPDNLLAKKHKELLTIPKKVRTYIKGDLETEYEELDSNAVSKGLDMGYKLKGKYTPEKIEHSGDISITEMTAKEKEAIKKLAEERYNAMDTRKT